MGLGKRALVVHTACLLALIALAPASAWAVDDSDRSGRWQFSLPITYLASQDWQGDGESSVDLHSDVGFGFGFGYNLNERFYVGGEITWIDVDYDAGVRYDDPNNTILSLGGELDASTFHFKGQYNILPKTLTPFIGGSFGWTYIDTNIASGPTQGVCWWDPWWGYICDYWQPTYDDTAFSYGLSGGLRAEVSDRFFFEFRYHALWVDVEKGDTLDVNGGRLELGWLF